MDTLAITIKLGGAAFADNAGAEVARILREYAERVETRGLEGGTVPLPYDINDNKVGAATLVLMRAVDRALVALSSAAESLDNAASTGDPTAGLTHACRSRSTMCDEATSAINEALNA